GMSLLPTFLFSFKTEAGEIILPSPMEQLLGLLSGDRWHSVVPSSVAAALRGARQPADGCKAIQSLSLEIGKRSARGVPLDSKTRRNPAVPAPQQALGCQAN